MSALPSVNQPSKTARLLRAVALAAIAGWAIYAFSPALQNQFGSVKPPQNRGPAAGAVAGKTLQGGDWSLANQRGKVVLLNFWATWCPPCRVETPALVELHNRYAARGFTVAGITMDDEPQSTVPDFVRKHTITYPILVPSTQFPMLEQVEALPTSILIDRSGRIARIYQGIVTERGLRDDIEALLNES